MQTQQFDALLEACESIKDVRRGLRDASSAGGTTSKARVKCVTKEGVELVVQVDTRGWCVVRQRKEEEEEEEEDFYETLHSLLVHKSPSYHASFGSQLMDQLNALLLQQQNE